MTGKRSADEGKKDARGKKDVFGHPSGQISNFCAA